MTRLPTPIRYLETITKHVQRHFGTDAFVLHEHKSSTVHVDLHVVPPNHSRPYFTLLTSGLRDLDMHVPAGLDDLALAEVFPLLSREMQFAQEQGSDALEERLNDADVTELLNPQRPGVV
jgi:hypothetical protein